MPSNPFNINGLSSADVEASRRQFGSNALDGNKANPLWSALKETITEPMFLLLVAAAVIYFLLGEVHEGLFMIVAIVLVSAISFYQDSRSRKALEALKAYTEAKVTVVRDGQVKSVPSEEIVVGDYVVAEEGTLVPADGIIHQSNDFSVNESILTGEAYPVLKNAKDPDANSVYQGTLVLSGLSLFKVSHIGSQTRLGKIGSSLAEISEEETPLQRQIRSFVRKMAIAGSLVFLMVWALNFFTSYNLLDSLLKGLTLAMSILPEEIPVAFTTFLALGAWRLTREGIIVKQTKIVETLGSATVICVDKTGTITENDMVLAKVYLHASDKILSASEWTTPDAQALISAAMWASEPVPFDPMEKALHQVYSNIAQHDERKNYRMVHEYPLSGKPPMMTHVFQHTDGPQVIACKGAPESIVRYSDLNADQQVHALQKVNILSQEGYRVLGVSVVHHFTGSLPGDQHDFPFTFLGLIAFFDPPKENIPTVFHQFNQAGIDVKIITGDNPLTTQAIARQAGLPGNLKPLDGTALLAMKDEEVEQHAATFNVFTRMFPEAKLRIINALKKQNHIVAMTGDGVNDGPALKAAHIGIAMGKRGSEIARQASALILTDDDLGKMVTAIAMGRKIYSNLKKAIQYIISIHIPIILTVALPLILGWAYPTIFTPVHVIFLELIMGPTCSIIYENEPLEKGSMQQPPRKLAQTFLSWRELSTSILQGLVITAGTLFCYQYAVYHNYDEATTRSMTFTALVVANIFLTLVNRSFYHSIITSFTYQNRMLWGMILITLALLTGILHFSTFRDFFQLGALEYGDLGISFAAGFASVTWFEGWKEIRRRSLQNSL